MPPFNAQVVSKEHMGRHGVPQLSWLAEQAKTVHLTPRALEVAGLLVVGCSVPEIEDCLGIRPSSIKVHTEQVTTRIGARGVGHVARILLESGRHTAELGVPDASEVFLDREIEAVDVASRGYKVRFAAGLRNVGEGTHKDHLQDVYGKLGIHNDLRALAKVVNIFYGLEIFAPGQAATSPATLRIRRLEPPVGPSVS